MAKAFGYIDEYGTKTYHGVSRTLKGPFKFLWRMFSILSVWVFIILAFVLCLAANLTQLTHQSSLESSYEIELDLTDMVVSEIIPSLGSAYSASDIGLGNTYVFGMYGYCRSDNDDDTIVFDDGNFRSKIDMTTCIDNDAMYTFDLPQFFVDELASEGNIYITKNDVSLPKGIANYVKTAKNVSRMVYVTSIISIILTFIAALTFLLVATALRKLLWLVFVTEAFGFFFALLAAASATGAFINIKNDFNNVSDTYGIDAKVSNTLLGLLWAGCILSFIAMISLMIYVRHSKRASLADSATRNIQVQPGETVVVTKKHKETKVETESDSD